MNLITRVRLRSGASKLAALGFIAAACYAGSLYPLDKVLLAGALAAYALILCWRPTLWLLLVPALLPVLDLAPWTGWFFFEEIDLLLLVTAGIGYWRLGTRERTGLLPPFALFCLVLLAAAYGIGTMVGLGHPPALDANAFSSYYSGFNSLRVAKGFFWMLVLLPLLLRSAGPDCIDLRRYFVPGMLLGLAGVCAAAVWERAVFPGLLNFASDYRITAPFSAMHTGGAALDGYLVLALPFVAAWLVGERSRLRLLAAVILLLAGVFVGLATFSRGVYLAYGFMALLFLALASAHGARSGGVSGRRIAVVAGLLAIIAYALVRVFATGGYRGLGTGIALLGAAFLLAGWRSRPGHPIAMAVAAVVLGGGSVFVTAFFGSGAIIDIFKGGYLLFGLSAALFVAGAVAAMAGLGRLRPAATSLAGAAIAWMAVNTVLVVQAWGGDAAIPDIAVVIGIGLVLFAVNCLPQEPVWRVDGASVRFLAACSIVLGLVIPLAGSYYAADRFSTVRADLTVRFDHWHEALAMMTPDLSTSLFGVGLGRYPETYLWKNTFGEVPSTYSYEHEKGNGFLRLAAPRRREGFTEVIRMLQRIDVAPNTPYVVSMDVRYSATGAGVSVAVCERLLLYAQNCIELHLPAPVADGQWHHVELPLGSGILGAGSFPMRAPTQIQMSLWGQGALVDIDNVSVLERQSATELVRNGSFSAGNDHWFFSSDHYHLPWHIKNFVLNVFFELGWFGAIALGLLMLHAVTGLVRTAMAGQLMSGVYLASLSGFMLVGLFDSLLDVPRLAVLFFLVLVASTLQPVKRPDMSATVTAPGRTRVRRRRSRQPAEAGP